MVYYPNDGKFCADKFPKTTALYNEMKAQVLRRLARMQVDVIDREPVLLANGFRNFYYYVSCDHDRGSHFNDAGNDLAADTVVRRLGR